MHQKKKKKADFRNVTRTSPTESQTVNFLMKEPLPLMGKCLDITLPVLCVYVCMCVCVRADLSLDSESSVPAVPSGLMRTSRGLSDSVCEC